MQTLIARRVFIKEPGKSETYLKISFLPKLKVEVTFDSQSQEYKLPGARSIPEASNVSPNQKQSHANTRTFDIPLSPFYRCICHQTTNSGSFSKLRRMSDNCIPGMAMRSPADEVRPLYTRWISNLDQSNVINK